MSDWKRYANEHSGGSVTESFQQSDGGVRERARQGVQEIRSRTGDVGSRARGGLENLFHEHPILTGLGMLAIGVAVGMTIPHTRQEDRLVGSTAQRVKDRARETASRVGDVAKASLEEARETARQELEGHGLDPQHLKESAQETAHSVREAAEKAASEARKTAEQEAKRNDLR